MCNGKIDVTWHCIESIYSLICRCLGVGCKKHGKMRTSRHRAYTNLFRIITAFLCLCSYNAYCSLGIFPSCLIDRKTLRTRCSIDKVDTLQTCFSKQLAPVADVIHVIAIHVRTARYQYDTCSRANIFRRSIIPLKIWHTMLVCLEFWVTRLIYHCGNLMRLRIRHLSLWPH